MKQLTLIFAYLVSFLATAQSAEYWVYFKGKPHAEQAIAEGRLRSNARVGPALSLAGAAGLSS